MLIFDAICAGIIFGFFGEQGVWVLLATCGVAFLRMSGMISGIFNSVIDSFIEFKNDEEDK